MDATVSCTHTIPLHTPENAKLSLDELVPPRAFARDKLVGTILSPITIAGLKQRGAAAPCERLNRWAELIHLLPKLKPLNIPQLEAFGVDRAIDEARNCLRALGSDKELLSYRQEVTLFKGYHATLHKAAGIIADLSAHEVPETASLDEAGGLLVFAQYLKDTLCRRNITLVMAMARRDKHGNGLLDDEKLSEANLALARCLEKFDWTRGYRFSTYACRSILKAFDKEGQQRVRRHRRFIQLDSDCADSHPVPSERLFSTEEDLLQMRKLLPQLDQIQQLVLRARFGLDGGVPPRTLEEIGLGLGLTKERIRQIQNKALSKLKLLILADEGRKVNKLSPNRFIVSAAHVRC